jgi:hypothetical protein
MHRCISCLIVTVVGSVQLLAQAAENLALRPDTTPIARVTAPTGRQPEDIAIMNNETTEGESYDSYDGANVAGEDWYGYAWSEPLYFDTLVFYEGEPSAAGGYWKSLTVQFSTHGTRWIEAGNVTISPPYDYSDDPDRLPYSRYELSFTGCLGSGVRIYGKPGGPAFFTSIAELEVYGTKPQVVCVRSLPTSYAAGQNIAVSLTLEVETGDPPTNLTVVELIPAGLTVADPGSGDTSQPGQISWSFGEGEVQNTTLSYSLAVPADQTTVVNFTGTLTYPGTPTQNVAGPQTVAPSPLPPTGLYVFFDVDAHLSWTPADQEGIAGYSVYRSENGGDFTDVSGLILDPNYVDHFVENGKSYRYKVVAHNSTGASSDLASSLPSFPGTPSMLRREFEDYDFEGGSFPGGESKDGYAARFRSDTDSSDFFYRNDEESNTYRPDDSIAISPFNAAEHYITSTSTDDWWHFTFDLPDEGFVKIAAIRAATDAEAIIEFLWDESHKGWFSFNTEGYSNWQMLPVDTPAFHSTSGKHTLRIMLSLGEAALDYFGIGFQQPQPSRITVFSDDFETYDTTHDVISPTGGWTILGSGVGGGEAAWQLWSTTGDPLGYDPPDLTGMTGKFVVSDGEYAGPGDLDEQLISPEIDCTPYIGTIVQFGSNIEVYEPDVGVYDQYYDLDIRTYDDVAQSWSDWSTVFHHEGAGGDDSSPRFVDVSAIADGKRIVLRWRFWQANYDYWWAVDNVCVTAREPVTGPGKILSVGIAADTVSLTWESFGPGFYRVQYTDDLVSGVWTDLPGAWPISEAHWTGDDLPGVKARFYRVVSEEVLEEGNILSVATVGDTISLTWEPFGTGSYRVQFTDDLVSGAWFDVPGAWPISEEQWTGDDLSGVSQRFYRVLSE